MRKLSCAIALLLSAFLFVATPARSQPEAPDAPAWVRADGTVDLAAVPEGSVDLAGLSVSMGADGTLHAAVPGEYSPYGAGMDNVVLALAVGPNGSVYAGGYFSTAGGVPASGVARWDGTAWQPLGAGISAGFVSALAVGGDGNLYVGGGFTFAGGVLARNVARWNGTAWSALGSGFNDSVLALAAGPNGILYAGGNFTRAGVSPSDPLASHVAYWNGTAWSALGDGTDLAVYALLRTPGGALYAGGPFTTAGGITVNHVARWDGTWSALDGGTSGNGGTVWALAQAANGDLYAGGFFTTAGSTPARNVARWDGSAWFAMGSGVNSTVQAMTVASDGTLYVGGGFTTAGDRPARNVARWGRAGWRAIGQGANSTVAALAIDATGDLALGGYFSVVGDLVAASRVARYDVTDAPGAFAFVRPYAFDAYRVGGYLKALWESPFPAPVTVVLSLRKGDGPSTVIYTGPTLELPNFGAARYLIPEGTPAGYDYTLRIEDEADPDVFAVSDVFGILDPGARYVVTYPSGGERLAVGSAPTVTWEAPAGASGTTVTLVLYDVATDAQLASLSTADDGAEAFPIPGDAPEGRYYLVVFDDGNPFYAGASARFRLSVVGVPAPMAGATFSAGDPVSVAWEAPSQMDPGASVRLSLKRPGQPAIALGTATGATGTFDGTLPASLPSASDYFVLVRLTSGGTIYTGKSAPFIVAGDARPAVATADHFAPAPMWGTDEATLSVGAPGLPDGTEVGAFWGARLVGAGVVAGGTAEVSVRGSLLVPTLVVDGVPSADDFLSLPDGAALTLRAFADGAETTLDPATPVAFAEGSETAVTVVGGTPGPASTLAVRVFPNPASGAATVRFETAAEGVVAVDVFDVLGRRVATLADGTMAAGPHMATWDAAAAAPGVYVVRVAVGGAVQTVRVTVAR